MRFSTSCFFNHSNHMLIADQWVKIFSIFVEISLSYLNFSKENLTPRSITHCVESNYLFTVELFCKMQNVALFSRIRIHIYFCDTVPV